MKRIPLYLLIFAAGLALTGCAAPKELPADNRPPLRPWGTTSEQETENEPPMPEEQPSISLEEARAEFCAVSADALRLRGGAGTEFPVLGTAQRGEVFPVVQKTGGWIETLFRGKKAYLSAAYTEKVFLELSTAEAEAVISEGYALLGTPYVYGAVRYHDGSGTRLKNFTAEAFDCSSLMQYIFYRGAGINLALTTRTQIKQGTHVREEDLRRGDLLFFTNAARAQKTGLERVGHVALYLGGGYILHTASDYAKIERISPLRQSYFLEARRVLP